MFFQLPAALMTLLVLPNLFLLASASFSSFAAALVQPRDEAQQSAKDFTDDDLFRDTVLNVTNTYRKQHNATELKWNDSLADTAGEWSKRCKFEHSGGPDGENLSSGYPNASASIIAWGHERVDYNFKKGEFSHKTGHFTQLVWKATTSVGCSRTECNGEDEDKAPGWFVICEYYPPGNVIGNFTQNVQEQVPEDEQPEGPDDPQVPDNDDEKECPQGGDCSDARRIGENMGALWVAVVVACMGTWVGL